MSAFLSQHANAWRLAWRRLLAAPINTLLSLLAIGVAAALPAGGQMLLGNLSQLARNVAPTPQLSLFMDINADKRAVQQIQDRLKDHAGIRASRLVTRDDALQRMRQNESLADIIDALPRNPFPDAFTISPQAEAPEAMERLATEMRQWPKVAQVRVDADWARRLSAFLKMGRSGVLLLAGLLAVGLVAITFNTIRLQVVGCRAEIELSRLLGATDAFIRRPFQYYGFLLGLIGGGVAWLIVAGAALWLAEPAQELTRLYALDFALRPLPWPDSLILLAAAAGLGTIGASLSLRQHLADH